MDPDIPPPASVIKPSARRGAETASTRSRSSKVEQPAAL